MAHKALIPDLDVLASYFADPVAFARKILEFYPDAAQQRVLNGEIRQGILCCSRGFGKTEITAVLACHHCLTRENAVVLVVSETAEKAGELVRRTVRHAAKAGMEAKPDDVKSGGFIFPNGSRILPVPCREGRVRGYAATLILVDEAALVPDDVWMSLAGTRASTYDQCTVWIMSTPGASKGFFYEIWEGKDPDWERIHVPATECGRITSVFLEKMRRTMDPNDFEREFMARYVKLESEVFGPGEADNVVKTTFGRLRIGEYVPTPVRPWGQGVTIDTGEFVPLNGFFICVDLGQARDRTVIAILEYTLIPTGRQCAMTRIHLVDVKLRLRWLDQFPLDTPYTDIAQTVAGVMQNGELQERGVLVMDASGVGRAVLDQVRALKLKMPIVGVQITSGLATQAPGARTGTLMNVSKAELVERFVNIVRRGMFEVAHDCPYLEVFKKEMRGFQRLKSGTGKWTYSGKASGGTDDMLMAVMMGVTVACERHRLDRLKAAS